MQHRLCGISTYRLRGLRKGDKTPPISLFIRVKHPLYFVMATIKIVNCLSRISGQRYWSDGWLMQTSCSNVNSCWLLLFCHLCLWRRITFCLQITQHTFHHTAYAVCMFLHTSQWYSSHIWYTNKGVFDYQFQIQFHGEICRQITWQTEWPFSIGSNQCNLW